MTYRTSAAEPTRGVRALAWAEAGLLVANLVWTTLGLGGYRPETFAVTATLTGALLLLHASASFVGGGTRGLHPASWAVCPFLLYAAFNAAVVTPVPWLGWRDWFNWANAAAIFWVVLNGVRGRGPRRAVFAALVALALTGVALSGYQCFARPGWLMLGREQVEQFVGRGSGSFGIPNSFAGFLLLLIPAAGMLAVRRGAAATQRVGWGWVAAVLLLGLFLTLSRGAWLALGAALTMGVWFGATGSWSRRLAWTAATVVGFTAVVAIIYAASEPARGRLDRLVHDSGELSRPILWHAAWALFRSQPVTGTGAGSYGVLFERHRPERFVDQPGWAHNEPLNMLSDYGVIGFALLAAGAVFAWRQRSPLPETRASQIERDDSAMRRAFGLGLFAFLFQSFVDFHFKIPALAMSSAVIAALALRPAADTTVPKRSSENWSHRSCAVIGGALAIVALLWARPILQGEAARYGVRERLDRELAQTVPALPPLADLAAELRHAVTLAPTNAQAWSDLAYVLELRAAAEPPLLGALAGPAEESARNAVRRAPVVPEFWIRLGVALDMQARRQEAGAAFERALTLAPQNAAGWYYYAYHLSLDTNDAPAALRAIARSLSLDPGNRAAEALRATITELR